jgi:hypothetical protein
MARYRLLAALLAALLLAGCGASVAIADPIVHKVEDALSAPGWPTAERLDIAKGDAR